MTAHHAVAGQAVAGGDDTIVALATPPGRSAIAVVRLSGPGAHAVAGRVASPWPLPERVARLCALREPASGSHIDRGIVTTYAEGRSYTGEPMVEIATHGGHLVPAMMMAALIHAGAREALPGEFTRRAVLNGRLDLLRAEAIGDLIDARSGFMHRAALAQLDGGLSRRIEELRHALIGIEALIAYDIDFPEEDDGPIDRQRIRDSCDALLAQLDALIATAPTGELVREGAIVVLAGAPNAGKSSLYNALLGEARAIVTEIPGTTRDALEATIDADGWPLRLVDTAGLRESADALERLGIEASERYLGRAHVVLACGETPLTVAEAAARIAGVTRAPVIGVRTKADIVPSNDQLPAPHIVANGDPPTRAIAGRDPADMVTQGDPKAADPSARKTLVAHRDLSVAPHQSTGRTHLVSTSANSRQPIGADLGSDSDPFVEARLDAPPALIHVSAITGQGLAELRGAVVALLAREHGAPSVERPMLTRARHTRALAAARDELAQFRAAWEEGELPAPVAAVHLREAAASLEALTGAVDVEDVLDRVFSSFCVGK